MGKPPNVIFLYADQWRGQATGFAGDINAKTPYLDAIAQESTIFTNAIAGCPVCSPSRASLLTGQYPLTHGVFVNDVGLRTKGVSIAQAYKNAGYQTAYIGKWHIDGSGSRSGFIPKERRQGFDYWMTLECTHNYFHSKYWGTDDKLHEWEGYDALAQTHATQEYIETHAQNGPFFLILSWGPPHDPYNVVPDQYRRLFSPRRIQLRPNVPKKFRRAARKTLADYYAHTSALDDCCGRIFTTLKQQNLLDNTLLIFTSDHGDLHYSQGLTNKQAPWEESIRVPLLIHYPAKLGRTQKTLDLIINNVDMMPTVLGLSGVPIPSTVEGTDYSKVVCGEATTDADAALLMCVWPFSQWGKAKGGREYRGIRTRQYTYVRALNGPWLLYDNRQDPFQVTNLCHNPNYREIQTKLDQRLTQKLTTTHDAFLPGPNYLKKWGYLLGPNDHVSYTD